MSVFGEFAYKRNSTPHLKMILCASSGLGKTFLMANAPKLKILGIIWEKQARNTIGEVETLYGFHPESEFIFVPNFKTWETKIKPMVKANAHKFHLVFFDTLDRFDEASSMAVAQAINPRFSTTKQIAGDWGVSNSTRDGNLNEIILFLQDLNTHVIASVHPSESKDKAKKGILEFRFEGREMPDKAMEKFNAVGWLDVVPDGDGVRREVRFFGDPDRAMKKPVAFNETEPADLFHILSKFIAFYKQKSPDQNPQPADEATEKQE